MVHILSSNSATINEIMRWLKYLRVDYTRLDINPMAQIFSKVSIQNDGFYIKTNNKDSSHSITKSSTIYTWHGEIAFDGQNKLFNINDERIKARAKEQIDSLNYGIGSLLTFCQALGNPNTQNINKIKTLYLATLEGLLIPKTMISGEKKQLIMFKNSVGPVIVKSVHESNAYDLDKYALLPYTYGLSDTEISNLPDFFFPSMFQEKIRKLYEIRTFYLHPKFYSMAIFSQRDSQTQTDFRQYNKINPNRVVPYCLPVTIEQKLKKLFRRLNLKSGSIDMAYTNEHKYIFFEVNPVGQFGMVSKPCNYYLEEEVAKYLTKLKN